MCSELFGIERVAHVLCRCQIQNLVTPLAGGLILDWMGGGDQICVRRKSVLGKEGGGGFGSILTSHRSGIQSKRQLD